LQHEQTTVANLLKKAQQAWADKWTRIETIKVIAMLRRYRDDNEENHRAKCQVEKWEIPV